ncbi:tetratricopeptide repeat protein [Rhodoferax sp.]|uniref:tetratricopeptide repeat protein n=1 Tax=Rhodoferax sp. TaxID=50421 RepID=UPI0026349BDF|nr:tetratricopeptide repeat protein [Rhodoferax sp.]MDD2809714.1 tetratricopeptide repeat protein [Rhodoferax sp.]MDD4943897.1 tetratricopeptide repeat protein [Rhodoferax sp.]
MLFILGLINHFRQDQLARAWRCAVAASFLCASGVVVANDLYERALDAIATGNTPVATELLAQLMQQQPNHAGAWLDMAMLYCSAGMNMEALALFDAIEARFAPPAGILELMSLQRANGCKPSAVAAVTWRGQLGRGFETNVNQGVRDLNVTLLGAGGPLHLQLTPNYAPRADGFTTLVMDANWALGPRHTRAWVQWQGKVFDSQHGFDTAAWQLGVLQPWQGSRWRGEWQASLSQVSLGGVPYQQTTGLRAVLEPMARWPMGWHGDMALRWSDVHYKTLPGFDARWVDMHVGGRYSSANLLFQGGVGWQADTALGQRPGGSRQGWSADVLVRRALGGGVFGELGGGVQRWLDNQSYAPGLIDQPRHQRSWVVRAALFLPVGSQGQWVLEARQQRNMENIALFGFDVVSVQLGYEWRLGGR